MVEICWANLLQKTLELLIHESYSPGAAMKAAEGMGLQDFSLRNFREVPRISETAVPTLCMSVLPLFVNSRSRMLWIPSETHCTACCPLGRDNFLWCTLYRNHRRTVGVFSTKSLWRKEEFACHS